MPAEARLLRRWMKLLEESVVNRVEELAWRVFVQLRRG
jgi:hypothetical protein